MTAMVDYGAGNLFSLSGALERLGEPYIITDDPATLDSADRIILPGVGAFGDAMLALQKRGLVAALDRQVQSGKPLMGICLGMQLLFERSYEFGAHAGLGYLTGSICPLAPDLPEGLKVPHIGWNALQTVREGDPLLPQTDAYVYYVHSFYAKECAESVVAGSNYGVFIPGVVRRGNVCGTQFHPEKSGAAGLAILRGFLTAKKEDAC